MSLSASDFGAFFEEVHGHKPFRWQSELAKKVCGTGEWPEEMSLPTGSGKTSVMDVAVFHLAQEAVKRQNRKAPIRIVFVVDRRLVVDDAFEHASKMAKKIRESNGPVTKKIAEALRMLSPSHEPLSVVKIRGGMVQETDWAKTPAQPLIIVSTVDQAGSRLLFRGYGVSHSMRPVHAGLLGSDVLYILDEAHTSQPFCDTMKKVRQIMQSNDTLRPFKLVSMSATLSGGNLFPPKNSDMLSGDELLQKRMSAHKHARLEKTNPSQQYDKFAKLALELAEPDYVKSVGIVVNRVGAARRIFLQLREKLRGHSLGECEVHLLIGRVRPLERDTFVKSKLSHIRDGASVTANKIFFVATQCIEVGVDISFDALVTQIAPIDSLRQRFGRLNRTGKLPESKAVIVATTNEISTNSKDPIYRDVLPRAWDHLKQKDKNGEVDFGIKYFPSPTDPKVSAPRPDSVTLFPTYVDLWAQTRPPPHPDPAPQFFLHGRGSKSPDVQVIWRADAMPEAKLYRQTLVSPPSQLEAVSVPIWAVKRWLSGRTDGTVGDVEGVLEQEDDSDSQVPHRKVILWHGKKSPRTKIVDPGDIVPGDTIIVPASYGGCDKYGWDDNSTDEVKDIGTESNLVQRRRITLRLNEQMVRSVFDSDAWDQVQKIAEEHVESSNYGEMISSLRDIVGIPKMWGRMLDIMNRDAGLVEVEKTSEGDVTRISGIAYRRKIQPSEISDIFSDSDAEVGMRECAERENIHLESSTDEEHEFGSGVKTVSLTSHSTGVQTLVDEFGSSVGLDGVILDDVKMAAFLHDSGKAEKRVQALLRRQDPDELYDHELIAKGISRINSSEEYNKCLDMAHLPKGYRHECWSVNLGKNHPIIRNANDRDLVLYLIGTHHGYGRPWFPAINDAHHNGSDTFSFDGAEAKSDYEATGIDSGWIDMVNRLGRRYGWWQLAYLETLLRLADHRQSEREQEA